MTATRGWGITVPFPDVPLHASGDLFRELADVGYTDVWSGESNGSDAFTPLVVAAVAAPSLRVGTGVVAVYLRGPALLAQSVAGLEEVAPGRVAIGVGSSSNVIVEQWNSMSFDRPYARVRDTIRFLRDALSGEKVTSSYETFDVSGFRLARPIVDRPIPPLLVGALRPGMLRLAGREGDGAILTLLSVEDMATVVPHVTEGGADKEIVTYISVLPVDDPETARAMGRRAVAAYLTVPVYAAYHEWLGRGDRLRDMWKHWAEGDRRAALESIPDDVVDDLIVHGPVEACREHVARFVEAGATTPVISLHSGPYDRMAMARALAPR